MATEKSLIDQIKDLPEIEFAALFEEILEHATKQQWSHITDTATDDEYENRLLNRIETLEKEVFERTEDLDNKMSIISKAHDMLEDLSSGDCGVDYGNSEISKVMDILND